jgi:hypothetical protein
MVSNGYSSDKKIYELIVFQETARRGDYSEPSAVATFLFSSLFDALKKCVDLCDTKELTEIPSTEDLKMLEDYLHKSGFDGPHYKGAWFIGDDSLYDEFHQSRMHVAENRSIYLCIRPRILGNTSMAEAKVIDKPPDECFIYNASLIFAAKKRKIHDILLKMGQGEIFDDDLYNEEEGLFED